MLMFLFPAVLFPPAGSTDLMTWSCMVPGKAGTDWEVSGGQLSSVDAVPCGARGVRLHAVKSMWTAVLCLSWCLSMCNSGSN